MGKNRLEAFSDGVIAIIITIMVLELKVPHGHELAALAPLVPVLAAYVLSFIYVGIYWSNHHHLLHAVGRVNGSALWANLHLLFWLSLFPFTTNWMGESHLSAVPTACYGFVLFMTAVAWYILTRVLIAMHGENSPLERAVGADRKGKLSVLLYLVAIAVSFREPWVAAFIYALVAAVWLVPDRRIERVVANQEH
ncbi:Potassium channel HX13_20290 [Burkholderia sp. 8Y]|uniref:TMEM175 family protein n=1 Tax=Burkholderia sp. 8Y TaxID=2653133 RepID=UPI0012F128BF|nr:TMEM175 family protein [Burkholderia sp. 8Y]VXB78006.1 Potassium channel HX13_20290 [Burkholderia sp. 8Y]